MPEEGVKLLNHTDILSLEEIYEFIEIAVKSGIEKVRITGGEPLIRKNIIELVRKLAKLNPIKDLSLTTNGILLEEMAKPLFEEGLNRINISLDTLNKEKYYAITRGGDLNRVLAGIRAAKSAERRAGRRLRADRLPRSSREPRVPATPECRAPGAVSSLGKPGTQAREHRLRATATRPAQ